MTAQIRKFRTKREAKEFVTSLGSMEEWVSHIYKGHRSYVVQFNLVEAYRRKTTAPVEHETESV